MIVNFKIISAPFCFKIDFFLVNFDEKNTWNLWLKSRGVMKCIVINEFEEKKLKMKAKNGLFIIL